MTAPGMKISQSSYDAYQKTANITVNCDRVHVSVYKLSAPDYPDSEKEQQARIRKEAAQLLRETADFLEAQ